MAKVQIFYDGDPISPSGIGKSQAITATVTQTLSVTVAVPSARFWLAGNGVSSVLATSATLSQGSKSIPITVNGATSFYIPATGRWSDYASIADFDLPGNVTISISFPEEVQAPTFGDSTDPDEPVATSAFSYSDIWTFEMFGSARATEDDGVICLATGDTPSVVYAYAGVGDSLPISFKTKLNKVGSMINFGADGLNIFFYNNNCICKISFAEDGVYIASLHQGKPPVDYNGYDVGYTTTKVTGASISSDWQQWTISPVTHSFTGYYLNLLSFDDWRIIYGDERVSINDGLLFDTENKVYMVTEIAFPPIVTFEFEIDLIASSNVPKIVNTNVSFVITKIFSIDLLTLQRTICPLRFAKLACAAISTPRAVEFKYVVLSRSTINLLSFFCAISISIALKWSVSSPPTN